MGSCGSVTEKFFLKSNQHTFAGWHDRGGAGGEAGP